MSEEGRRRRRRPWRIALAIAVIGLVLTLIVLAHRYVLERVVFAAPFPPVLEALLATIAVALSLGVILQPAIERFVPARLARAIAWPAYVWMGAFFLLLCTTLGAEALAALARLALPAGSLDGPEFAAWRALAIAAVGGAATALGVAEALRGPRVARVELRLARWPSGLDGFRIVQISDIHIGTLLDRRFAAALAERVNELAPDLVAVTGDLVDGSVDRLRDEVAPFGALRARHGVYFVTGNHDWYSGAVDWVGHLRELGFVALRNERVTIGANGAHFDLAGVDDHRGDWRQGSPCDVDRALGDRDASVPVVLLAHDPATFAEASRHGVDLQLSGHTHGGQIWPFRWLVRLSVPWVEGLHERNGSRLYVSRGTGFWGPPLRFLAPAEITEIVLRA
jgi:predicted MPP superfamily phosphohydrolase